MSIDPLAEDYPYNSTYAFQENKMGMGRELEGLELAPFVNVAFSTSTPVTSTPLLGAGDAIKIGVDVGGKAAETAGKTEVHHVIPRASKGSEVVQAARKDGFKFEGAENKIPVEKFSKSAETGRHGPHPKYNAAMKDKLDAGPSEGVSPVEFIRNLVSETKDLIKNNPDVKINDILKTEVVIDNTSVPKPDIPKIAPVQTQTQTKR